jgi:hypothetical protein
LAEARSIVRFPFDYLVARAAVFQPGRSGVDV